MLDPNYLLRISEGAEEVASQLHERILEQVVKRIMLRIGRGENYLLTAQDKWQLEVLQEAGYLREDIVKEIAKKTKLQQSEIRNAFRDAGVRTLDYDDAVYRAAGLSPVALQQSPVLIRLLQRGYEATLREWTNYTRSTADAAQRIFLQECDQAYWSVISGAESYTSAVKRAVERVAENGVKVVYPSGHEDTIETATLRAVRTGVSQTCGDITNTRMDEMGWDIVLTSAHLGARVTDKEDFTNHYWWQGRFFSRSGNDPRFPPYSLCGEGEIQGIHGINCRHSHGPGDGEHNPYEHYDSEENRKAYELTQRQRAMERKIRKTKRECMAYKTAMENADDATRPELEEKYREKAASLQAQNKAYNSFCEENNLPRLQDRLQIAGWGRSQAASATTAARIANSPKKLGSLDDFILPETLEVDILDSGNYPNGLHDVVPQGVVVTDVEAQAGYGTKTVLRDRKRLEATYGKAAFGWQKKSGTAYGSWNHYVIHWYEYFGYVPEDEIKLKGAGINK